MSGVWALTLPFQSYLSSLKFEEVPEPTREPPLFRLSSENIITVAWPRLSAVPWWRRRKDETCRRWEERFLLSFLRRPSSPSVCVVFSVRASLPPSSSSLSVSSLVFIRSLFFPFRNFWSLAKQPERWSQVAPPINHRSSAVREAFTFSSLCLFFKSGLNYRAGCWTFRWTKVGLLPIIRGDGSECDKVWGRFLEDCDVFLTTVFIG